MVIFLNWGESNHVFNLHTNITCPSLWIEPFECQQFAINRNMYFNFWSFLNTEKVQSWKIMPCFYHTVNTMTVDDLWTQGAWTSAAMVIKSPQYTGGDFMFLYRFVRRRRHRPRRRRPQILVHAIALWTTFWISFIFGTIVGPDL